MNIPQETVVSETSRLSVQIVTDMRLASMCLKL